MNHRTIQKNKIMASALFLLIYLTLLAFCFAQVEIQIEGPNGWASNLPTWRLEKHQLLDIFWGGRPLTGYHFFVFIFIFLAFHLPLVFSYHWNFKLEARVLGSVMLFWIIEDFLWFIFNPAYGLARLTPADVPWHKIWFAGLPIDYYTFGLTGIVLIILSFYQPRAFHVFVWREFNNKVQHFYKRA